MTVRERSIPCSDFPEWKHDLELTGYHVEDSTPDPTSPGFCIIRFDSGPDHVAGPGPAMAAALAAPLPTSATLGATQKRTALAIVNIFETGAVLGSYGQITLIDGDSGHLTFGRSQTTLATGNLFRLISNYCDNPGARLRARLVPYLPRLKDCDTSLDQDFKLHNILRASADDPVMRDVQDIFFDLTYWQPAAQEAASMGIRTPLGIAMVYDSMVHGSWRRMRDATNEAADIKVVGEQRWISAYIAIRRAWMASHVRADIRATTYRMDAFKALVDHAHWALELPLVVRDQEISAVSLAANPPGCYDGPVAGSRSLSVRTPFDRGADVRLLQLGLSDRGIDIKADGVFGASSAMRIKEYQLANGMPATGVADVALIASLTA